MLVVSGVAGVTTCSSGIDNKEVSYSIAFSEDVAIVGISGGMHSVHVTSTHAWTTSTDAEWISFVTPSGTGNGAVSFSVDATFQNVLREGVITFSTSDASYTNQLTVHQMGFDDVDNSIFLGATTEMGRRFVLYSDGLVSNVTSDKQYAINEEVSVLEIAYTGDATGSMSPYAVFFFDVKLENGTTLRATAADDEDSSIKPTTVEQTKAQIIRGQLAAMQNNRSSTLDVLAGVNADFFGLSAGNNMVRSIMYRGGVCLKSTFDGGATFGVVFALMTNGTARIMNRLQYEQVEKSEIYEAVCGSIILLSNGTIITSNDHELHPRTAAGISSFGNRVFLLVVDGRREGHSVGASYLMLSKMLLAMGAHDAVNLDGGGSSTFAVRTSDAIPATAASFQTLNRPTDNAGDRAVANGVAIVKMK